MIIIQDGIEFNIIKTNHKFECEYFYILHNTVMWIKYKNENEKMSVIHCIKRLPIDILYFPEFDYDSYLYYLREGEQYLEQFGFKGVGNRKEIRDFNTYELCEMLNNTNLSNVVKQEYMYWIMRKDKMSELRNHKIVFEILCKNEYLYQIFVK